MANCCCALKIWFPPFCTALLGALLARNAVQRPLPVNRKAAREHSVYTRVLWRVAVFVPLVFLVFFVAELVLGAVFLAFMPDYGYFLGIGTKPPHLMGKCQRLC